MIRVVIAEISAHRRRLAGTALAVLVGVSFLAATLVLTGSLRSGFDDLFARANENIDAVVRHSDSVGSDLTAQRGLVDAATIERIASLPDLTTAAHIEGLAQITGSDGRPIGGQGPPTVGAAWIDDAELNPWEIHEGRPPDTAGEVVIDRRSAETGDLSVGDVTTVRTPEPVEVEVVGIATFGDDDTQGTITYAAFDPATARELLLGGSEGATMLVAAATDGRSEEAVTSAISEVTGEELAVVSSSEFTQEQLDELGSEFLNFFEAFLLVFSGIAVAVAGLSIHNTFAVISAQRTRNWALLRAVGASRRQVLAAALGEAVALAAVASAVAVGVGTLLAAGLIALLSGLGTGLPSVGITLSISTVAISMLVGVVLTAVAALGPAVKASATPPLAAIRDVSGATTRPPVLRAVVGAVLAVGGVIAVLASSTDGGQLSLAGIGAIAVTAGAVALGPVIARPAASVAGWPMAALRGLNGQLARRNAMRNPRRTAGTATALMIGVSVVTLFTVFADSVKTSVDQSVDRSFGGDMVIGVRDFSGAGISPAVAGDLEDLAEVEIAAGIGIGAARLDGTEETITIVDPARAATLVDTDPSAGDPAELEPDEIAVSQRLAEDRGWDVGQEVSVGFVGGDEESVTIGAVYEAREIMGDVMASRQMWDDHARTAPEVAVLIGLASGAEPDEARGAIDAVGERYEAPAVQDRDEYVATLGEELDQFLVIIYALLALSILIALMGIANTLGLAVTERTREIGLLRAVGQSRSQVRSMVRAEAVLVSAFGTLGGLLIGGFLAWGVMGTLEAAEGLGAFSVPLTQVAVIAAAGAAVGVIAAVRPARRAARTDVLAAISAE